MIYKSCPICGSALISIVKAQTITNGEIYVLYEHVEHMCRYGIIKTKEIYPPSSNTKNENKV